MIRTSNLERALNFYCGALGLIQIQRIEVEKHRFTYIVLATNGNETDARLELIHNWDETEALSEGRNFGHLAFEVENIYGMCERIENFGAQILRAPHEGHKAFIQGPDGVVIELLQKGLRLQRTEPWMSMQSPDEHLGN